MFYRQNVMKAVSIGNKVLETPIIQGGMGVGVSLSGLASAVANQGGAGVISAVGIGMTEPGYEKNFRYSNLTGLKKEIRKAKKSAIRGLIGVNIMMAVSDFEDLLKVSIEERTDLIFIGAGLFLKLPDNITFQMIDNSGTKIIPIVSSARAAQLIFKYWSTHYNRVPDAIAVEGPLAGGHLGFKKKDLENNTFLLSDIIKETYEVIKLYRIEYKSSIPIIAAGGIYTGNDIAEIMSVGADAVILGSRFVPTFECDADINFKKQYLFAEKDDIILITSPVGLPGRAIQNNFLKKVENGDKIPINCPWKCLKNCNYKDAPYCIAKALFNSAQGNMEQGFAFCGANAYKTEKIVSVKKVFDELLLQYKQAVSMFKKAI